MGLDLYVCDKCGEAMTGYSHHEIEFSNSSCDLNLCTECLEELIESKSIEECKGVNSDGDEYNENTYKILKVFKIIKKKYKNIELDDE